MIVVDHSQLFGAMWIVVKGEGDRNTRLLYKYGNLAVSQIDQRLSHCVKYTPPCYLFTSYSFISKLVKQHAIIRILLF